MESTRPIDGNIRCSTTQLAGSSEGRPGIHTTEIKHVGKDRAILDTIEVVNQMLHVVLVARSNPGSIVPCEKHWEPQILMKGENVPRKKVDVVFVMVTKQFGSRCGWRIVDLMDLFVKPVANHEGVDESQPVGLHRMVLLFGVSVNVS